MKLIAYLWAFIFFLFWFTGRHYINFFYNYVKKSKLEIVEENVSVDSS